MIHVLIYKNVQLLPDLFLKIIAIRIVLKGHLNIIKVCVKHVIHLVQKSYSWLKKMNPLILIKL